MFSKIFTLSKVKCPFIWIKITPALKAKFDLKVEFVTSTLLSKVEQNTPPYFAPFSMKFEFVIKVYVF